MVEGGTGDWDEVVTRQPYRKVLLDHLLSKEHNTSTFPGYPEPERGVAGTQYPNVVLCWLLKELWNYWLRLIAVVMRVVSTAACPRGKLLLDPGGGLFAGMLLGPEATRLGAYAPEGRFVSGVVFENCRVDASIFVVKLLRAHGGCLGFRSR